MQVFCSEDTNGGMYSSSFLSANQLSHNITELVFVFYFHFALKLQQDGCSTIATRQGLTTFFFFLPFDLQVEFSHFFYNF